MQPGEGASGFLGSIGVDFKLWSADTGGSVAIVEHPFPVGAIVPAHLHTREDEWSIVTAGAIGFRSGNREVVLESGGYITKPRGEMHTMWNAGNEPAQMIEVITPGGFEGFFHDLSELLAAGPAGPPDPVRLGELGDAYGVVFGPPDWYADIVWRYRLNG